MKKFLYQLNNILLVVSPYYWDEIGIFRYISPNVLTLLYFIWSGVSLYFILSRFHFYQNGKVLFAVVGSLLIFFIIMSLIIIYSGD